MAGHSRQFTPGGLPVNCETHCVSGNRTHDLPIVSPTRYQLCHSFDERVSCWKPSLHLPHMLSPLCYRVDGSLLLVRSPQQLISNNIHQRPKRSVSLSTLIDLLQAGKYILLCRFYVECFKLRVGPYIMMRSCFSSSGDGYYDVRLIHCLKNDPIFETV